MTFLVGRDLIQVSRELDPELPLLIEQAKRFHGHLGPFLVVGLRLGLAGIEALSSSRSDQDLRVTAELEYRLPISCTLDGIQTSTGCTFGNGRLRLVDSNSVSATFERARRTIEVSVAKQVLETLKMEMATERVDEEILDLLAYKIASMDHDDLFES